MSEQDPGAAGSAGGDAGGAAKDDKPAVSFKTEGEFLAAVQKRSKGDREKAVETAKSEIFSALGIESADDLAGLAERLKTTEKTVSEHDKLKSQFDKQGKEFAKLQSKAGELSARLVKIAKRDALLPFVGQTVDPDVFNVLMEPLLEVDEDGAVTVKSGGKLENLVEDLFKAKAYLKKTDAAKGAGTGAKEPLKAKGEGGDDGKADGAAAANGQQNGTAQPKKTFGQLMVEQLKAKNQLPGGVGP